MSGRCVVNVHCSSDTRDCLVCVWWYVCMLHRGGWWVCQVFSEGLSRELGMSQQTVDALFPRLDDLLDVHTTFLDRLLSVQSVTADKSIESIGPVLIQQVRHWLTGVCSRWSVAEPCKQPGGQ